MLSSISFINFEYMSFTSLIGFTPRYLILFDVILNGIVLMSLADSSLLVFRNARDFCVLILYPATSPNSLIHSRSFLVGCLGFSMYSILSSAVTVLLLPFWFGYLLFLHFLVAVAGTSKTMLNKSGHPHLFPNLGGNAFSFLPPSMMLAMGMLYIPILC